ncbi:MAG: diguanylate cyclase [Magnetococcus sp. XQGC-1]
MPGENAATPTAVGLTARDTVARILIVDDDGFTRMLLKGALEGEHRQVFEAHNGQQALDHWHADPASVDLLITDLNMPGMTGTVLVQTLRREGCRLPIIVLSGNDDVSTAIGVIHDGADDYLLKDENIEETVAFTVNKVLDKAWMEQQNRQLLEALQQSNHDLAAEVVCRQQREAQIQRDYESRTAINRLLESAMAGMALEQQLEAMLDIILSVPWFDVQKMGAIFLLEEQTGDLLLKAERGLTPVQRANCSRLSAVHYGQSPCMRTLEEGKLLFIPHDEMVPDNHCTGISQYGRYIVPVRLQHRTIGVVKLYLAAEHQIHPEEEPFLHSVASTLASVLERKQLEEALKQKAEYDPLTGFANRALFYDRLTQAIGAARRTERDLVLMFIDLDRFKQVNDTLGHEAGDRLLQEASRRIGGCLRGTDLLARLGGDEFTIILPWLTHAFYIEYVARRILEELNRPFFLPQGEASISGSIGITFFPHDAEEMDHLLKNADAAMYQAKEAGRSTFRFFTPAMNEAAMERMKMEHGLVQAWENSEFVLYYHPVIRAQTGQATGVEVQLRWHRPGAGCLRLDAFATHLEQTDLLVPLGLWMLETACRQYANWLESGVPLSRLLFPLSLRQLQLGKTLVEMARAVLEEVPLPPGHLAVEIECAVLMEHWEKTAPLLATLREMGLSLVVGKVGEIPFSPARLQGAAIHAIKPEMTLLAQPMDAGRTALLQGVLAMAKPLGWQVLVPGVETEKMADFLKNNGCDYWQGGYASPAMEADGVTQYLAQWR